MRAEISRLVTHEKGKGFAPKPRVPRSVIARIRLMKPPALIVTLERSKTGSLWAEWSLVVSTVAADPIAAGFIGSVAANVATAMPAAFARAARRVENVGVLGQRSKLEGSTRAVHAADEMVDVVKILASNRPGQVTYRSETTKSNGERVVHEVCATFELPTTGSVRE